VLGFIGHNLMQMAFHRWHRFGFACVNFGTPVSAHRFCSQKEINLSQISREDRFACVQELGNQLMESLERVIPILPISIAASVLLQSRHEWLSEFDVKTRTHAQIEELRKQGAPILIPTRGMEIAISTAFRMLILRRMLVESDGLFRVLAESTDILSYYANSIAQWQKHLELQ